MAVTSIRGKQVLDGSIQRADLDTSTAGQSVVAKLIQGTNISLSSTGGDAGTGDVTISATTGASGSNAYTLSTAGFTVPPVGSTVSVSVSDASWIALGEVVWIDTVGGPGVGGTMVVTAKAGNTLTLLNSASQATVVYPYDIGLYWPGTLVANAKLSRYLFDRAISFAINLAGSLANAGTASTASVSINIAKNGTSIGSLTFAAAATNGVFSIAVAPNFAIGDVMTLTGPASPDATLADLSITLTGTRT